MGCDVENDNVTGWQIAQQINTKTQVYLLNGVDAEGKLTGKWMSRGCLLETERRCNYYSETLAICQLHDLWEDRDTITSFVARLYWKHNMASTEIGRLFGKTKAWLTGLFERVGLPRKGRGGHKFRSLQPDQVRYIRSSVKTNSELGVELNVPSNTIRLVRIGVTYKDVK